MPGPKLRFAIPVSWSNNSPSELAFDRSGELLTAERCDGRERLEDILFPSRCGHRHLLTHGCELQMEVSLNSGTRRDLHRLLLIVEEVYMCHDVILPDGTLSNR